MMTSKDRFFLTVNHKKPDRVPIDYLACPQTDDVIKNYYAISTEEELLEVLGCDFYYLPFRDISQNESCFPFYKGPKLEVSDNERICPFGIRFKREACNSKFSVDEAIRGPLEDADSSKDILSHRWPKVDWFDLEPLHRECEIHKDKVIIGGMWSGILGDSYRMIGFENFLLKMALNPKLIKTLVDRMTEFYLELNDYVFSALRGKIDVWFFGNDYASQSSLLFSKQMFCEFFYDNIKRLVTLAKSYDLKIMEHTCGAVSSILPLLIEAGVDIIDPVQVTAVGMEPDVLKKNFGSSITFHGGIDTQHLLPYGSKDEVFEQSKHMIEIMSSGGGYIFAPSQVLGPDIPAENIAAMYQAAKNIVSSP